MVSPKVVLVVVLALIAAQDMYRAVAVRSVPHVVAPVAADHSEQPQGDASASATPAAPASSDVPDAAMLPDIADARSYSVGDRVHVSLCVGCQYGGKFNKLKQEIEAALPGIQVTGSNHPVGFARTAASYAVLGAQAGLGALILAGDKIFEMLGKPMPGIVNTLQQSKMSWAMGTWYLGSMVRNYLASSGAFEVAYNGDVIHSKLALGHFPDVRYLIHKIEVYRKQANFVQ